MPQPCPHCGMQIEVANDGSCPQCGQGVGSNDSTAGAAPGEADGHERRQLLWLVLFPLVLAAAALAVAVIASPDEEGPFVMVQGRGGSLSHQENAEFLQKLRDAGYNVPPAAIEESRQDAAIATNRRALATVAYVVAAASLLAAVLGFAFGGGPAAVKSVLMRRQAPPA